MKPPRQSTALRVEQLEDRSNPSGTTIPAGEFNWTQYSPTGELGQLVWEGQTLVYRNRVSNAWSAQTVTVASGFSSSSYDTRDQVQKATQSAQLVFTSDGTPHVLFLQSQWASGSNAYQTVVRHYARIGGSWKFVENITANWMSNWGPTNIVAEAGTNNSIHFIFAETYGYATGAGNTGSGILWYATNKSGSWKFDRIANTADLHLDVWFSGGRWAPRFLSLAVDGSNNALVTYCPQFYIAGAFSTVYSELRFATNAGGAWKSELVMAPQDGTADAGLGASIAVSPTGQIAIASYYAERFSTGSPQSSKLMYHVRNPNGTWTHSDVATSSDGYAGTDGTNYTGFSPQLYFDSNGRANIVFSDEAGQHLPVTYANEFSGQIRVATLNGSRWSVSTPYRQGDPLRNQMFFPVAAAFNGQTTFAGLQVVSTLDSNKNIVKSDFALVDVGAPWSSPGGPTTPPPPPTTPTPVNSPVYVPPGAVKNVAMVAATDAEAGVNSAVVVYRSDGSVQLKITPFGPNYSGGARVARADVTGDGVPDVIVGSGGGIQARVRVWNGATNQMIFDVAPFENFTGGVVLTAGDLNGDKISEIIIGPDNTGGPRIQVWTGGRFTKLMNDFYGIPYPQFRGGIRLASADVNKDGIDDLFVAPGIGGGPRITLYDGKNLTTSRPTLIVGDFFAFGSNLRTGMYLAAGDIDGDGYADLIAGMGDGGPPQVRIFSGAELTWHRQKLLADFLASNAGETRGVKVGVTRADSDSKADLLIGTQGGRMSLINGATIMSSPNPALTMSFAAFSGLNSGLYVG